MELKLKKMNIMKRPFLVLAILLIFAILIYRYINIYFSFGFVFVSMIISSVFTKRIRNLAFLIVMLPLIIFSVWRIDSDISVSKSLNKKSNLNFTVCSDYQKSKNSRYVVVKSNGNNNITDRMKFYLYFRNADFKCGDNINAEVTLFKNSDEKYRIMNLSKQIYGSLWLNDYFISGKPNKFYSFVGQTVKRLKMFIDKNLSFQSASVVKALILGDKSFISDDLMLKIQKCGVSHLLVVSGLHLSVIMGFILLLLNRITYNKYINFFVSLLITFLISALCGFTPSVIRASLMFVLFSMANIFNREGDELSIIGFSLFVMLFKEPMLLFNISFQMSFLAFFSVIYVAPFYLELLYSKVKFKKFSRIIFEIAFVSLIAQVFTSPISVYNFGYLSVISPIVNVFLSFAVTLILIFAVCTITFYFIPFLYKPLFLIMEYMLKYFISVLNFFGSFTYSAIVIPKTFAFFFLGIIVLLMSFIFYKKGGGICRFRTKKS